MAFPAEGAQVLEPTRAAALDDRLNVIDLPVATAPEQIGGQPELGHAPRAACPLTDADLAKQRVAVTPAIGADAAVARMNALGREIGLRSDLPFDDASLAAEGAPPAALRDFRAAAAAEGPPALAPGELLGIGPPARLFSRRLRSGFVFIPRRQRLQLEFVALVPHSTPMPRGRGVGQVCG